MRDHSVTTYSRINLSSNLSFWLVAVVYHLQNRHGYEAQLQGYEAEAKPKLWSNYKAEALTFWKHEAEAKALAFPKHKAEAEAHVLPS